MRYRLLAADAELLRQTFGDLLDAEPAKHDLESLDPFTNTRRTVRVPVAKVDLEVLRENSWELDSMTELIERALVCPPDEAEAQLELVKEGGGWTLMAVSEGATQALTSAPGGSLGNYHIELEEGQRLYLYWEP